MAIRYKERQTGRMMDEPVAGEAFLRWSCETLAGKWFIRTVGSKKCFSSFVGFIQNRRISTMRLKCFIQEMNIDMEEAERSNPEAYHSFNDFFTRKLRVDSRPIPAESDLLISPSDGRLLAFASIKQKQMLQVKGKWFSISELLLNDETANAYECGSAITIRLNPSDYHRFHFPADGTPGKACEVSGRYFSVNPLSLRVNDRVYCRNKRQITMINSLHFGKIAMVEVGAALVGSIVQTYTPDFSVQRGTEKGYFQFGGSTIILLFEPGRLEIDPDLAENTMAGHETLVRMGERLGQKKNTDS